MRIDDPSVDTWLHFLMEQCPTIEEVWLIGSRANNSATAESDWDFIAFGSAETVPYLRSRKDLYQEDVDLLIVYDGNQFQEPWGQPSKTGSLSKWGWRVVVDGQAIYDAVKWREAEDGAGFVCSERLAVRVFERE